MQDIATFVNFIVVLAVLWHFGRKPTKEFLSTRSVNVARAMEEASAVSSEAALELSEWERRWNSSKAEVQKQMEETRALLAKQHDLSAALAKKESARIQQEAILVGVSERTKAEQGLKNEIIHRSVDMARRYLGKNLDEKDQHKLVADYLEIVRNGEAQ